MATNVVAAIFPVLLCLVHCKLGTERYRHDLTSCFAPRNKQALVTNAMLENFTDCDTSHQVAETNRGIMQRYLTRLSLLTFWMALAKIYPTVGTQECKEMGVKLAPVGGKPKSSQRLSRWKGNHHQPWARRLPESRDPNTHQWMVRYPRTRISPPSQQPLTMSVLTMKSNLPPPH